MIFGLHQGRGESFATGTQSGSASGKKPKVRKGGKKLLRGKARKHPISVLKRKRRRAR